MTGARPTSSTSSDHVAARLKAAVTRECVASPSRAARPAVLSLTCLPQIHCHLANPESARQACCLSHATRDSPPNAPTQDYATTYRTRRRRLPLPTPPMPTEPRISPRPQPISPSNQHSPSAPNVHYRTNQLAGRCEHVSKSLVDAISFAIPPARDFPRPSRARPPSNHSRRALWAPHTVCDAVSSRQDESDNLVRGRGPRMGPERSREPAPVSRRGALGSTRGGGRAPRHRDT